MYLFNFCGSCQTLTSICLCYFVSDWQNAIYLKVYERYVKLKVLDGI